MTTTELLKLIFYIIIMIICITFIIGAYMITKRIINLLLKSNETKNKQIEHEKLKLYSAIDTKAVREELNSLIRIYVARYMTKNIIINQIAFIKNDQVDEMVKSIIKDVILEMSDLYLSYCKLLYNIKNEEDLTKVIYYLTIDIVLDTVTNFNKSE